MEDRELSARIKTGAVDGLYFFWGDEDFMKNRRTADLRRAAVGDDPSLAAFNTADFNAGDGEFDLSALYAALLAPPMMAEHRMVTLFHPALDSMKEKERGAFFEMMKPFSDDPAPGLVFVLRASAGGFDGGTKKKPSPFLRGALKIFSCVEFPYESESRLSRWMERHFAEYGLGTDPGVTARILASAGRSMYRLQGEVAKIGAYAAARGASSVTAADVDACVARTDEEDAFALANAILAGDTGEALRILNLKKSRREDPGFVLAQVTRAMNDLAAAALFAADGRDRGDFARSMKMNEYRAGLYYRAATAAMTADPRRPAAAAEACEEAERQMKTGAAGYLAVERLICSPAVGGAR